MPRSLPIRAILFWLMMAGIASAQGSWRPIAQLSPRLNDLFFLDRDTGWIADGDLLLRTVNGGLDWDTIDRADDRAFTRIFFIDATTGWRWAQGGSGPSRSDDGGHTWRDQTSTIPREPPGGGDRFEVHDCFFLDGRTGWAVGNYLSIMATTDGGATWTLRNVDWSGRGYFIRFDDVEFSDSLHGIAVGGNNVRVFARTTDGGLTWQGDLDARVESGGTTTALSFPDDDHAFAPEKSGGRLWRTTDGGGAWSSSEIAGASTMSDVAFTDSLHGWLLDRHASPTIGTMILATDDGGGTWRIAHRLEGRYLDYLSFPAIDVGYAAGYSGTVLKYSAPSSVEEPGLIAGKSLDLRAEPNPAVDHTRLGFHLNDRGPVRITIFDLLGRAALPPRRIILDPGYHTIQLDMTGLAAGAYQVWIESDSERGGTVLLVRQ